jgi:hypothetical protein
VARNLLRHFGSVEKVFVASEKELKEVELVGGEYKGVNGGGFCLRFVNNLFMSRKDVIYAGAKEESKQIIWLLAV